MLKTLTLEEELVSLKEIDIKKTRTTEISPELMAYLMTKFPQKAEDKMTITQKEELRNFLEQPELPLPEDMWCSGFCKNCNRKLTFTDLANAAPHSKEFLSKIFGGNRCYLTITTKGDTSHFAKCLNCETMNETGGYQCERYSCHD